MNRLIQTVAFINNCNDTNLIMLLNLWQPFGQWLKSEQVVFIISVAGKIIEQVACSDCYQTCCLCAILFLRLQEEKLIKIVFLSVLRKTSRYFCHSIQSWFNLLFLSTSTFLVLLAGHKCLCYLLLCGGYLFVIAN